jgi:ribosome-binding protein aMBF1 (putative translation factor)
MQLFMRPWILLFVATILTVPWLFSDQVAKAQTQSQTPVTQNRHQRAFQTKSSTRAADPSERNRLAEDAHNALVKAVTDRGLSVEEYTSILEVAENDPDVREKLLQRIHLPAD